MRLKRPIEKTDPGSTTRINSPTKPTNHKSPSNYYVVGKRLNMDNISYDTLTPKDKIYAAFITAYKNSESYKNKKMMADMRVAQEKYQLSKDTIALVSQYLNTPYGDNTPDVVHIILQPNVAGVIPSLTDYLPGWKITPIPPNPKISRLVPMPTIIKCERSVI